MRRITALFIAAAAGAGLLAAAGGRLVAQPAATLAPTYLDQGQQWGAAERSRFYAMDQGSEIMPLAWARALVLADGTPFLAGRLARYGYLPNPDSAELPVGFTAATRAGTESLGMTCAACHTREIEVDGQAYRVDGGPALSDFQRFLADLDAGMTRVATDDAAFAGFADRAGARDDAARTRLKGEVARWYRRQHALFSRALPSRPWGVGRLDAVSMIFNRVSGLDIGTGDDHLIEANIFPADAPVRYPFIWDAPKQDRTQWPGFAENGDAILAMARNLGEVYGVFASFHPIKNTRLIGYDYHSENSANFEGLGALEQLVKRIGAPRWPWPVDAARQARGAALFTSQCSGCHGQREGKLRLFPVSRTWATPLVDVGTDSRQYEILGRTADTGVMQGALFGLGKRLGARDRQFNILAASVIGSLADRFGRKGLPADALFQPIRLGGVRGAKLQTPTQELAQAYHSEAAERAARNVEHPYEARVLHGIWATAPYLHNGSVPTLAELLTRPEERVARFTVGRAYDREALGLARLQPGGGEVRQTSGCEDLRSGNSRCGHPYGTDLDAEQKRDLLEFLKTY